MEPTLVEHRLRAVSLHTREPPMLSMPLLTPESALSDGGEKLGEMHPLAGLSFIGRAAEIERVLSFVHRTPRECRVVFLYGSIAVGKSALARHLFALCGGHEKLGEDAGAHSAPEEQRGIVVDMQGYLSSALTPLEAMRAILIRRIGSIRWLDRWCAFFF